MQNRLLIRHTALLATLLLAATMVPAANAINVVLPDAASCPNDDKVHRSGTVVCAFMCAGGDKLTAAASASQTLERITAEASCGGGAAACSEPKSSSCSNSNGIASHAHNAGECEATGFDPWWAGRYTLTAECSAGGSTSGPCEGTDIALACFLKKDQDICDTNNLYLCEFAVADCSGKVFACLTKGIKITALVVDGEVLDIVAHSLEGDDITAYLLPQFESTDVEGGRLIRVFV